MALPTWKAIERRTTLLGGKAVPGISCTPVDVQSPFPMSIPTVKSSRRRAPCHDYPHLATAHRPPPPIIPADRRIIYEARCDTESGIRRSRSTFTQNRGNVRSFVRSFTFGTPGSRVIFVSFRFVLFRFEIISMRREPN